MDSKRVDVFSCFQKPNIPRCSMGLVYIYIYLPRFTINLSHSCRQIYHTWSNWNFLNPKLQRSKNTQKKEMARWLKIGPVEWIIEGSNKKTINPLKLCAKKHERQQQNDILTCMCRCFLFWNDHVETSRIPWVFHTRLLVRFGGGFPAPKASPQGKSPKAEKVRTVDGSAGSLGHMLQMLPG